MSVWSEVQAKAANPGDDLARVKALPIAYVLEKAGIDIDQGDGKLVALCPFHPDKTPSLDVYGEKLERWGCFPCGLNGDVLDLIGRLHGISGFTDKKAYAETLLQEMEMEGWRGPTVGVRRVLDIDAVRARVNESRLNNSGTLDRWLEKKVASNPGLVMSGEWLRDIFGLGETSVEITIPYWDRFGNLITYKHRSDTSKALSAPGSNFGNVLYGEWLDTDLTRPVLLCEGESDVWAATFAVGGEYSVLGVPTGSGAHPKQADNLKDRRVLLAFDGDRAGRLALMKWYYALLQVGCDVSIVTMPDGYDLAMLAPAQIEAAMGRARKVTTAPATLMVGADGYYRTVKDSLIAVSNWTFSPERELLGATGTAYEGVLNPLGVRTTITSDDLSGNALIKAWTAMHGVAWYGADKDGQTLLGMFQAEAPFLATGHMATVAGLHENHFIYPGGSIGPDYWQYVPPVLDASLDSRVHIVPGAWTTAQVHVLRELHVKRVMDPILAWLAAAPVRSLLREFPILAITGSSGTGKTTLIEAAVQAFTGTAITSNLTSTTQHALFAFMGCTNAFPVWFDEFRPGARKDTLEAFAQVLRDAYTAQESSKGGMGAHWAKVTSVATGAPLVVSGEDAFSETSHTERMVLLNLPLHGRDPVTLGTVRGWQDSGLAHAYLTWLHEGLRDGWLPWIHNYSAGPAILPARQQLNLGVLDLGWELLNLFLRTHGGEELGDPDWSLVIGEATEAAGHNPILDSLIWASDEQDADYFMKREGHWIYLRPDTFVTYVKRHGEFILPGGPLAIKKYLIQNFEATHQRVSIMGKQVRAMRFPASCIGL